MATDHIYLIINKYLSGEISHQESRILEQWANESEENRNQLSRLAKIWEATGNLSVELDLDTGAAWRQVESKTHLSDNRRIKLWGSPFMKVAASVLILISLGALIFLFTSDAKMVYKTAANERKEVLLPDGSEIWLNQNSTLSYQEDFAQNRILRLTGEAFFEVVHDEARPFTVESSTFVTTVLGTSFTVNDYQAQQVAEVVVARGKVKVQDLDGAKAEVYLEPGTQAVYSRSSGKLSKTKKIDPNFLAWKQRRLQFENTGLGDIEKTLEDYFDVEIKLSNEQLRLCQFTGTFNDPTLEEVLQVLSMALDISSETGTGGYLLNGEGCVQDKMN